MAANPEVIETASPATEVSPHTEAEAPDINYAEAAASIAAKSFGEKPANETPEGETPGPQGGPNVPPKTDTPTAAEVAEALAAPKSWAKETHDLWKTAPRALQEQILRREEQIHTGIEQYRENNDFGRTMKEIVSPYMPAIQAQGLDPAKAVQSLLNMHHRLTQGSPDQRAAAYQRLGQDLGLVQAQAQANLDPHVKQALDRVEALERERQTERDTRMQQVKTQTAQQVAVFADEKDAATGKPLRPYFDEVANDIAVFVQAGDALEVAYDKAVWANPVTREKQRQADMKAAAQEAREKSTREANAARQARSTNVNGRDTSGSPTESQGTIKDTLAKTFDKIQSRSSH